MRRSIATALLALTVAVAGCGGGSKKSTNGSSPGVRGEGTQTTSLASPARPKPKVGANGCLQVSQPPPRNPGTERKPKAPLDPSKRWALVVKTSCGSFTIALDLKTGPHAAASMVALARSGFFKDTTFHRIVPDFVIQGGDPTATGNGGPGYATVDKPPANAHYTRGVVAMAKTQTDPAGTGGSQFFVVTGADAGLPPDYALLGRVTKGLSVVERIGRLGNQSQAPTQPVVVDDVVVKVG